MNSSSMNKNRTSKKNNSNLKKASNNKNISTNKNVKKNVNKNPDKNINRKNNDKKVIESKQPKTGKSVDVEKRSIKNTDKNIKKFPSKPITRERSKKDKIVNKKKKTILALFFTILGVSICFIYLAFNLSTFDLKKINVTGNTKYTDSEIISKSNFNINDNVFLQYLKYKDTPLKDLPYVSNITISLCVPDEININVLERVAEYIIYDKEKNKFFKVDIDGYILEETSQDKKQAGETLVYGVTFNDKIILGEQINEIDLGKLKTYEKIVEEYSKIGIDDNITKVNFENSLTTITLNDKLNVILPNDTNLKYNLDLLKSILKQNGDLQGVIDMTKTDPVFSIF